MDRLLSLIQHDPLASRADLAAQLDTSVEEVNQRIAAYEADGVIIGYQTIIDSEKLPEQFVTAVIEVKITPEREGGL